MYAVMIHTCRVLDAHSAGCLNEYSVGEKNVLLDIFHLGVMSPPVNNVPLSKKTKNKSPL